MKNLSVKDLMLFLIIVHSPILPILGIAITSFKPDTKTKVRYIKSFPLIFFTKLSKSKILSFVTSYKIFSIYNHLNQKREHFYFPFYFSFLIIIPYYLFSNRFATPKNSELRNFLNFPFFLIFYFLLF